MPTRKYVFKNRSYYHIYDKTLDHKRIFLDECVSVFTLMPNHFHLLVQQKTENGIVNSMTKIMDSITRYYNIRNRRKGPLFLPHFNAVPILSKQQLLYVSKYIHLNPLVAGMVKTPSELLKYKYSTLQDYSLHQSILTWIDMNKILKHFNHSKEKYWQYLIGNRE